MWPTSSVSSQNSCQPIRSMHYVADSVSRVMWQKWERAANLLSLGKTKQLLWRKLDNNLLKSGQNELHLLGVSPKITSGLSQWKDHGVPIACRHPWSPPKFSGMVSASFIFCLGIVWKLGNTLAVYGKKIITAVWCAIPAEVNACPGSDPSFYEAQVYSLRLVPINLGNYLPSGAIKQVAHYAREISSCVGIYSARSKGFEWMVVKP